jgi:predicted ester cyclase
MLFRALLLVGTVAAAAACGGAYLQAAASDGGQRCSLADRRRNEATVRVVYDEILSQGRIAENERIYHPDFRVRGLTRDATRAEDRAASEGWRKMAPDLRMTVLNVVSDCDYVSVHWEGTGTNTGEGNGIPATGRSIRVRGMTLSRLKDGQIIEEWTSFDQYAFLKQLGLIQN